MSTTKDVREQLFKTMKDVSSGAMNVKVAQQVVKAASQITCSLRTDIEQQRLDIKILKSTKQGVEI